MGFVFFELVDQPGHIRIALDQAAAKLAARHALGSGAAEYSKRVVLVGRQVCRLQDRRRFVANEHGQVALERKTARGWVRFAVEATDEEGVAVRSVAWKHRVLRKVRAVTLGTRSSRPSRSRIVRIG